MAAKRSECTSLEKKLCFVAFFGVEGKTLSNIFWPFLCGDRTWAARMKENYQSVVEQFKEVE